MAPAQKNNKKSKASPMRKVRTGRIGQSSPTINTHTQGHADKKLTNRNKGKELFPRLIASPPHAAAQEDEGFLFVEHSDKPPTTSRNAQQRSRAASKKAKYLKQLNKKLRLLKAIQDGTAKRLNALHNETDYKPPKDARDQETVPYAQALLNGVLPSDGPSTLNIKISCGFWGYEMVCTASKVYTFRVDTFANPERLQKLIFSSQDAIRAMKQMGVHLSNKHIKMVGYEVHFPKGLRHKAIELSKSKSHKTVEYTARSDKVLVNTACALREFWQQARDYSADERGNVIIPVVARIGISGIDPMWGTEKLSKFTEDWRSDLEMKWLDEEQRIELERQQFVSDDQQKRLQKRMRAIEDAADKAMQQSHETSKLKNTDFERKAEEAGEDNAGATKIEATNDVNSNADNDAEMTTADILSEDLFWNLF